MVSALCAEEGFTEFVQFDVGQLLTANDDLLRRGRKSIPPIQIVNILLYDRVAAADERGIFFADERGVDYRRAARILGAVHKSQQVAVIEVTKAVNLVDR